MLTYICVEVVYESCSNGDSGDDDDEVDFGKTFKVGDRSVDIPTLYVCCIELTSVLNSIKVDTNITDRGQTPQDDSGCWYGTITVLFVPYRYSTTMSILYSRCLRSYSDHIPPQPTIWVKTRWYYQYADLEELRPEYVLSPFLPSASHQCIIIQSRRGNPRE